jgi:peptidoglycan/LPS O-acetylase OafA/YrhL
MTIFVLLLVANFVLLDTIDGSCLGDVKGSYGDLRETGTEEFAYVVAEAGTANSLRWSKMASLHAAERMSDPGLGVASADICRGLCNRTNGCEVWTWDTSGSCRAMATVKTSPSIVYESTNATTGGRYCNSNFLPFPDTLSKWDVLDSTDLCYKSGYLYGDCIEESGNKMLAPLLAVHAPQFILDKGVQHRWWDSNVVMVDTGSDPYATARKCSKKCTELTTPTACSGFTMTHGICLLRGSIDIGGDNKLTGINSTAYCRASSASVRQNSLSGPPYHVAQTMECAPEARFLPPWFEQCDLPRCTDADVEGGSWYSGSSAGWWTLGGSFPADTRDYVYQPKDGKCFFPVYNRTELRDGMLSPAGAWVLIGGGSNSFGMGATVMKAIHNDDGGSPSPNNGNRGITEAQSDQFNKWRINAIVDTIRHADGTSTIRRLTRSQALSILGGYLGNNARGEVWSATVITKLTQWMEQTEALHTPGSIRVTHVCVFFFNHFQQLLNIASRATVPWPRLLAYSHSIQRYANANDIFTDLTALVTEEVCARNGNLCFIGSRLPYNTAMRAKQLQALTGSPVHFLDFAQLGLNNFEIEGSHGLQSLHMYVFQIMLNMFDLDSALTPTQRAQAIKMKGCPEALRLDKQCTSAASDIRWNEQNAHLCEYKRDDITPMFGLSAFQRIRALTDSNRGGSGGNGSGSIVINNTNGTYINGSDFHNSTGNNKKDNDNAENCILNIDMFGSILAYEEKEIQKASETNPSTGKPFSPEGAGTFFNTTTRETDNGKDKIEKQDIKKIIKIKSLCGNRIFCGYETDAWVLGMGVAIGVGLWYALKKCFNVAFPPPPKKRGGRKPGGGVKKSRRMSLDPGNGGRRPKAATKYVDEDIVYAHFEHKFEGRKRRTSTFSRQSTVHVVESVVSTVANMISNPLHIAATEAPRGRRQSVNFLSHSMNSVSTKQLSTKRVTKRLLSTAVGERLTSLGPARFMASMHIVAGHLYQKNALGPMYFLSWGFTWVPWFFMLSGYVLMHARLNSRTPNRIDTPTTALWKRTSSIFPMYAIGVILDMVVFLARGSTLPDYHILIGQSFLVQSWVSYLTENALQSHCWFLSAMVIYWLCFGPAYRCIRSISLRGTVFFMFVLALIPWFSVWIPMSMDNLTFYKSHQHGKITDIVDHLVITLKFNPICYAHVFLFGMCLSRFRNHVTRREDSYETSEKKRPCCQNVLMVPFRSGACLGYLGLFVSFIILKEAGAAKAKISARLGILMPLQGFILLGLSPLRGRQIAGRKWQWGADPLANIFQRAPGWIGDVSYR